MIDLIYQIVLILGSKDIQGYLTPDEFNKISNLVQMEIFRSYFEDENKDKNRQNRGLSNQGYANLSFNQRQKIQQFAAFSNLSISAGKYSLPNDLYLLEEHGLSVISSGNVIDEVERKDMNYLNKSIASPSSLYPVYERFSNYVYVYPTTITESIGCRYLRKPKNPNWTYFILPNNEVKFDPTNPSYQDFELDYSEFSNIVIRILAYFGVTIREADVVQVAEGLKQQIKQENEN